MTLGSFVLTTIVVASAVPAFAQTPPNAPAAPRAKMAIAPPGAPPPPPATRAEPTPPRARREAQPVNVKVDLVLTDQRGGALPIKRTLTVLAADGYTGSIRTTSQIFDPGSVPLVIPLNVDASPTLLSDGKIRLGVNLQYDWPAGADNRVRGQVLNTSLHDQLMMILENGKSMIVAQSADPVGDRQVTVEVKATIMK